MGILGFLFRAIREKVQEQSAKGDLEDKLGRKVSTHDLYSLGSHLDAAQPNTPPPNAPQMPFQSTPREASVPFSDAKPPMKTTTKLLLVGVPLLLLFAIGAAGFVMIMPRQTYNRLNPFTPKPPEGTFPAQVGNYTLDHKPDYYEANSYTPLPYFRAEYKSGSQSVQYSVYSYPTEAELNAEFEKRRKSGAGEKSKVVDNSDTRIAIAAMPGWSSYVIFKDGTRMKHITAYSQKAVLDFEGFLKNAPPVPVVALNEADLSKPAPVKNDSSVTVLQLLDDYKKDETAADTKYKGKTITVTGTVEVSQKDKNGSWMIAFMRPGSTAPKDGMVVCSFEKSEEAIISKVKKGDTVSLRGKVTMSLIGNVVLQNCSKL